MRQMMNKALEIIEAHWLFGLPAEKIEVIVHPQSIVPSFVEYVDGSVIAQCGPPSMKTPIQYALTWPDRLDGCGPRLDWEALQSLEFEQLDHERFPSVSRAWDVIEAGGTSGAIFNAANEVAVSAFLAGELAWTGIAQVLAAAFDAWPGEPADGLESVLHADRAARRSTRALVEARI